MVSMRRLPSSPGGRHGIGRAAAVALAGRVFVVGPVAGKNLWRRPAAGVRLGGGMLSVPTDVRGPTVREGLFAKTRETFGGPGKPCSQQCGQELHRSA